MASLFACGQCQSTEMYAIFHVSLKSDGKVKEIAETDIVKCANCAARYQIVDGSLVALEQGPQRSNLPRVRSSVSAAERGKDLDGTSRF